MSRWREGEREMKVTPLFLSLSATLSFPLIENYFGFDAPTDGLTDVPFSFQGLSAREEEGRKEGRKGLGFLGLPARPATSFLRRLSSPLDSAEGPLVCQSVHSPYIKFVGPRARPAHLRRLIIHVRAPPPPAAPRRSTTSPRTPRPARGWTHGLQYALNFKSSSSSSSSSWRQSRAQCSAVCPRPVDRSIELPPI